MTYLNTAQISLGLVSPKNAFWDGQQCPSEAEVRAFSAFSLPEIGKCQIVAIPPNTVVRGLRDYSRVIGNPELGTISGLPVTRQLRLSCM